jgi:Flp pilus assembly protein TadG
VTRDRGAADALGLVVIFPAMLGLALLVLFLGRQVDTRSQVQAAADAAAEAAALQRSESAAVEAAARAATAILTDARACPGGPQVAIDAGAWSAGRRITVTVACSPSRAGFAALTPPARTFSASATASIDPNRAPGLP